MFEDINSDDVRVLRAITEAAQIIVAALAISNASLHEYACSISYGYAKIELTYRLPSPLHVDVLQQLAPKTYKAFHEDRRNNTDTITYVLEVQE